MNENYPPLLLIPPQIANRRLERRPISTPPEILARRTEIARRLLEQVVPFSDQLRGHTEEERRAIFYKVEHERPVDLGGTDLKPIADAEHLTLAVPRSDNLDKFVRKIERFATQPPQRGKIPHDDYAAIISFHQGEPKDRLSDFLADHYDSLIAGDWVLCEIEILSVASYANQQTEELQQSLEALMKEFRGGTQGTIFEQERAKGTIRAVIRCSGRLFQRLVEAPEWQTRISWFQEKPDFETFHQIVEHFNVARLGPFTPPPPDAPVVCVIDTRLSAGNPFLTPVTREDLTKSFLKKGQENPADEYGHGSGVASLVAYRALNLAPGGTNEGKVWVCGARILDAENKLEDERLFSKVLEEVVAHYRPYGIRIFNLSVNDRHLRWSQTSKRTVPRNSWVARAIDRLSKIHDVVFVVSTGNIPREDVRDFTERGQAYPQYFCQKESCLHDPAQAALAITVGAIAGSTLIAGPIAGRLQAVAELDYAAPFTRSGPGVRQDVKPELVDLGGNYVRHTESSQVQTNLGTNVAMASHQLTPALAYDVGTSFSAAVTSHKLALVLHDLRQIGLEPSAALLKAFLVNSAQYPVDEEALEVFQQSLQAEDKRQYLNILGYGVADDQRATYCDAHSVTLYYEGVIEAGKILFLDVPVPAALTETGRRDEKRLTVTVVHTPDVQRWGLEEYLGTVLKWRLFRGDVPQEQVITEMSVAEPSALHPAEEPAETENLKEVKFALGVTLRSRGTIQHDVAVWKEHRAEFSENHYTLAIGAYERWGRSSPSPVSFAVVVRLEDRSNTAEIYSEVQTALVALQVRTRV